MANVPALTDEERAELQRLRTEVTRLRTEVEAKEGDVPAAGRGPARQRWRTIVATLLIALLIKAVMGLRVTEEEEVTGIDTTVHAESAYELGGIGATGSALPPAAAPSGAARPSSVEVR